MDIMNQILGALVISFVLFIFLRSRKKQVEEEPSEEAEEEPSEEAEEEKSGVRIDPINRGGRPRVPMKKGGSINGIKKLSQIKPELICWQRERLWFMGIEVPEELLNKEIEYDRNKVSILKDDFNESRLIFGDFNDSFMVQWINDESGRKIKLSFEKKECFQFKLSGSTKNTGRFVKYPTIGSFLVIAPKMWERDKELSGLPPISPQSTFINIYRGHFFNLNKNESGKIAFRNQKNELKILEVKDIRFDLLGNNLVDSCEFMGPLYGDGPLSIQSLEKNGWDDVKTIVIGEEGRKQKRWRTQYSPDRQEIDQPMPQDFIERGGGWYFVRLYDTNDDLLESFDFRYASGLNDITLTRPTIFPGKDGHKSVKVTILHTSNIKISSKDVADDLHEISCGNYKTTLLIHPHSNTDYTSWFFYPTTNNRVQFDILVERVWWGLGDENIPPKDWVDHPINLTRKDFSATSKKTLFIRLPKSRWTESIQVGFENKKPSSYEVRVNERIVSIPLRHFSSTTEIESSDRDSHFYVSLFHDREELTHLIATLPRNADFILKEKPISNDSGEFGIFDEDKEPRKRPYRPSPPKTKKKPISTDSDEYGIIDKDKEPPKSSYRPPPQTRKPVLRCKKCMSVYNLESGMVDVDLCPYCAKSSGLYVLNPRR